MKNFVVVVWAFGSGAKVKFHFISEEHKVRAIIKAVEKPDVWDEMFEAYPTTDEGAEQMVLYYNDGDMMVDAAELPH